jgi:hypothetical protein
VCGEAHKAAEHQMRRCSKNPFSSSFRMFAILLCLALALPAWAYDYPLSSQAIRDAYFLGSREGGLTPQFLAQYSHRVSELHQGNCTSEIRLETPFLQVTDYTSKVPNYSSQDAVKAFYDKPLKLRIFLNLCYMREAPPPYSVKIKIVQNKKEVVPASDTRFFYAEPIDELAVLPPNGERVQMEFDAQKFDSSTITFLIDTPNGQHVTAEFDLQGIR